jgi:hypothetical protein
MPSAEDYRQQAAALYRLARATADQDEAFAHILRAIEFESLAEELEQANSGYTQVQQRGSQPPPPPHQAAQQPAQQQQQVQPKTEGDE